MSCFPKPDMVYITRVSGITSSVGDVIHVYHSKGLFPNETDLDLGKDLRVAFEDGTVIRIGKWSDNIFRIAIQETGTAKMQLWKYDPEGANKLSDVFHIDAYVKSVRRVPHKEIPQPHNTMTCNVRVTVDLKHARNMLGLDGHSYKSLQDMSDKEIFDLVLEHLVAYGGEYSIRGEIQ